MKKYEDIPINSGLLRTELRKMMNDLADDIAGGGPPDWASYQRCVGKIEGFAIVERMLVDEIEHKTKKEEDE